MRLPVRLKTRLDTRLPVRMGTKVETRYFRKNEGTTDYISIPDIVLSSGDFIEFNYLAYTALSAINAFFFDTADGTGSRTSLLFNTSGYVNHYPSWASSREDDGVVTPINGLVPLDGKLHKIRITADSNASGRIINRLMANTNGGAGYGGPMYDFKHYSGGVLVRHYAINDNNSTIVDSVSGQNGTVINGSTDDWGLFKKLPNGNWQGINLSAAWDSPTQILEVV